MITREFNLYLHAGHSIPLVINVNQYDRGETWVFTLFNSDGTQYTPSSGAIVGIKSDNLGIINTATVDSQGRVVVAETQQMTAAVGKAVFELLIDDQTHGTANFIVLVEPKPGDNADLSESDYSLFQQAIDGTSAAAIAQGVSDWMDDNLTPTTPVVDASLTVSGAAADAKKTGDEISDLKSQLNNGVPYEVKLALNNILQNVAFKNDTDYSSDRATINAWATSINVTSISAVFDADGETIYTDDALDDLKQYLTVTASYSNGTSAEVSDYTLSGELNAGQSTITVAYGGKTTSFNVTAVAPLYSLPNVAQTTVSGDGRTSTIKVEDGLVTVSGSFYSTIYVDESGNVTTTQPTGSTWFTVNSGTHFINKAIDIDWTAGSGSNQSIDFKWANADASGNLATATKTITSSSTGTDGEALFDNASYGTTRNLSAFAFQWKNNSSSGGTVSFRLRMFVDDVRYF